jgi:predicted HAD superfamily phosphohydrolase
MACMSESLSAHLDALTVRHRHGDEDAFEQLVALTEPELRIFLMSRTRLPNEVEEAIRYSH